MDVGQWITLAWLLVGVLLVGSELFAPGLVSLFLGASALLVAALRYVGLIDGLGASVAVWMVSATVMVFGLRRVLMKYMPSETTKADVDESRAEFGREVEVISDVTDQSEDGRIRFQGTTWKATTTDGVIRAGETARIVFRDNLVYVIERIAPQELAAETTAPVPLTTTIDKDEAR